MFQKLRSDLYNQVEESSRNLHHLLQAWELFEMKNTYLTSRDRHPFTVALLSHHSNKIKDVLRHFVLDHTHKTMLAESNALLHSLQERLRVYNDAFIQRRMQEYAPLFDGKEGVPLDTDQRRAVVVDDQHNLVVAAAGSGKTRVLTIRIAYLVQRTDAVAANKILALAFNRNAAQEMKARLHATFHIDAEMMTFHSFGNAILRENGVQVSDVKETRELIDELFPHLIQTNPRLQQLFLDYISNYLQEERAEADFQTKEEYYQYMNNQRYLTLSGIQVKSLAEKEIANFFFMHAIPCEYEKLVRWLPQDASRPYHPDFYLPDYDIYIEHWGLSRNGQTAPWINAEAYKQLRDWKIRMFRQKRKILVETWDYERMEGTLIPNLQRSLQSVNPRIQFRQLSHEELINKVYQPQQDKTREIKKLLATIITHAKSNFLNPDDFERQLQRRGYKPKTRVFGEMALIVYQEYERSLKEHTFIDYNDMVNLAIDLIKANPGKYADRYEHILIDEFQDISNQRLELIKCFLNDTTRTKLFCVGDDWQSIYKFAGSEVEFFVDFERYFAQPAITSLETNYRSSKRIIDASTQAISFNKNQRRKQVRASQTREENIHLYRLAASGGRNDYTSIQAQHVFTLMNTLLNSGVKPEEILVLSRFTMPLRSLEKLLGDAGRKKYEKVRRMTVHRAKGAEATHVFLLSVISGVYGFPSELEDDAVLEIIKPQLDKATIFEEERRLFYVALTRSKMHLYLYTQEGAEFIFLKEIERYLAR